MYKIVIDLLMELGKWIDRYKENDKEKSEKLEQAATSFRKAITETQIYLGLLDRTKTRDFETELMLARIWSEASKDSRLIDKDFSNDCYKHSLYWTNPPDSPLEDISELHYLVDRLYGFRPEQMFLV